MVRNRAAGGLSLPAELDTYVQDSILHMLEPCSCQEHLQPKLAEAEDSQRQMQLHVHKLLRRLEETEVKCAKSRVHFLSPTSTIALCLHYTERSSRHHSSYNDVWFSQSSSVAPERN